MTNLIFAAMVGGSGWALAYVLSGSHEWGWRGAVLGLLVALVETLRTRTERPNAP